MDVGVGLSGVTLSPPAVARGVRWWRRPGMVQIIAGIALVVPFMLIAIAAPWISPHEPNTINLAHRLAPPVWMDGGSSSYLLGTDQLGRDLLSRLIYGARVSMLIGTVTMIGAGIVGVTIGLLAGYLRGTIDVVVTSIAEIQQSFPFLALAIVVIATVGHGLGKVIAVLILGGWILFFRVVRGEAMSIAQRPFIDGARAIGASHPRIILRYILPNIGASVIVIATFNFAWFITAEASLSFLGLGVDPSTASWGQMLSDARAYFELAWWYPAFPGIALVALVLGANMLGDGLQNRWDPFLK